MLVFVIYIFNDVVVDIVDDVDIDVVVANVLEVVEFVDVIE